MDFHNPTPVSCRQRRAYYSHGKRAGYDHTDRPPLAGALQYSRCQPYHELAAREQVDIGIQRLVAWLWEPRLFAQAVYRWRERAHRDEEERGRPEVRPEIRPVGNGGGDIIHRGGT